MNSAFATVKQLSESQYLLIQSSNKTIDQQFTGRKRVHMDFDVIDLFNLDDSSVLVEEFTNLRDV